MKTLTPLRYPGGKTKLYPYVSEIIKNNYKITPIYAEAFAGGFGLGMKLLLNNEVKSVLINDLDYCIFSFWKCVTSQKLHNKFIDLIKETDINISNWKIQKEIYINYKNYSMLEVGFATFFLNRCNRSGVLLSNPIGGINQTGKYKIDCRYNKNNLIELIEKIYKKRKLIKVFNLDAKNFIKYVENNYNNVFFNFDPPYVKAGPELYKNHYDENEHFELSKVINKIYNNKWILTYDCNDLILNYYKGKNISSYKISYSLENKIKATEILVKCDSII